MKFTASIGALFCAAGLSLAATSKCNADSCARAVTGTGKRFPTQLADCSSYQACTLTPAATVVTSTTTVTPDPSTVTVAESDGTTTPIAQKLRKVRRQRDCFDCGEGGGWNTDPVTSCPTAIPAYASACSGPARYSSACACMGVTKSIFSTALTPTYTSTATVYADASTVTVTAGASTTTPTSSPQPQPQPPGGGVAGLFKLQIRGSQYEGQYLVADPKGGDYLVPVTNIPTPPSDGDGFSGMFSLVEQGEARSFGDLTAPYYNRFTWYSDNYYGSPVLTRQFSDGAKKFRCHVDGSGFLQCNNNPVGNLNSYWNLTSFRLCEDSGPKLYINRQQNANDRCWSAPDIWLKVMWKQ